MAISTGSQKGSDATACRPPGQRYSKLHYILESALQERERANPDLIVQLRADESVLYKHVAKTMAIIERSGISKLAVVTIN
ncbi:ExbD/TolR family protein [Parvibium lacunae]|uniref:Biopolymer transporter ExbD n=1 Tax=Parvibium lacunae TaxID=1888893 RepID=A0A368L559_9BURK|nr:biopolymer transporter ExbD [Parvibium lacunae]RCS58613.1 hypothetical protein DU000_07360 [Parvibium lacunae]